MKHLKALIVFVLSSSIIASNTYACSNLSIQAKDGTVVSARTLDFALKLADDFMYLPKDSTVTSITPEKGVNGKTWQTKYDAFGFVDANNKQFVESVNSEGLYIALQYYPRYSKTPEFDSTKASETISIINLGSYIVTNFKTIEEVKQALPKLIVASIYYDSIKLEAPVHFIVKDKTGQAIVIEYTDGKLNVFNSPFGILTNSPSFDWHMTNLNNYVALSPENQTPKKIKEVTLAQFGNGSGALGLPGDFTPASRFVRATFLVASATPATNAKEALSTASNLIGSFNVPNGVAREGEYNDITLWTNLTNLNAQEMYYKLDTDINYTKVSLSDFASKHSEKYIFNTRTGEEVK